MRFEYDGAVNILDVVAIVSSILGTDARSADATSATMNREGGSLTNRRFG